MDRPIMDGVVFMTVVNVVYFTRVMSHDLLIRISILCLSSHQEKYPARIDDVEQIARCR